MRTRTPRTWRCGSTEEIIQECPGQNPRDAARVDTTQNPSLGGEFTDWTHRQYVDDAWRAANAGPRVTSIALAGLLCGDRLWRRLTRGTHGAQICHLPFRNAVVAGRPGFSCGNFPTVRITKGARQRRQDSPIFAWRLVLRTVTPLAARRAVRPARLHRSKQVRQTRGAAIHPSNTPAPSAIMSSISNVR